MNGDSPSAVANNLEIAQRAVLKPVAEIAADLGLRSDEIESYGEFKAKLSLTAIARLRDKEPGRLICVAGMTPTKAGEGKTTTAVGLTQGLGRIGRKPVLCLREPSLGPVFGMKGGAAGGGLSQVVPMEDLNLHFTGDIHAIGAANNLLAAMLDASLLHGNPLQIDPLSVCWRRALDINDRALRQITVGQGGRANGYPRETGFDITAASEVMAVMAVARDLSDLRKRLGAIAVAETDSGELVTAEDLGAAGAMAVLLKDALKPNLIQTLEGQPCLMHCGPFANIAHGNSSLVADLLALRLGDFVVTESGFGSDMGMEKFFNIVCRTGGLVPSAVVLVCTLRALAHHGGGDIEAGADNLRRHIEIARGFGVPCVVAVNRRPGDADAQLRRACELALDAGAGGAEVNEGFERGGEGAIALAHAVAAASEEPRNFRFSYELGDSLADKIKAVAIQVYGAQGVHFHPEAERKLDRYRELGLDGLAVCMAKTQYSLSDDPGLLNAPSGFVLSVRDLRAYTGAGWVVALCGDVMQMPGLGPEPAARAIDVTNEGQIVGLF